MKRSVTLAVPSGSDRNSAKESSGFQRWMLALCAIRFDLEQGQVVESCYPEGAITSEEEILISRLVDFVTHNAKLPLLHNNNINDR